MNKVLIALVLLPLGLFAAGRQLTGVYTPAQTPALTPAEAQKKFTMPPGFEMRIFASEPDVVNPVAMTWDERGRLWVVELYEYPLGAPAGKKPRDNVKILEDTDADGKADKVTVFADGLNLATAILVGNGGVYVGQAPHLYFMEDTNGDDVADKKTIVATGFGLEDRHELLNGFTWGPDGWLYMTHGVFTHSKVKDPNDPEDDGVKMDAAVARFNTRTKTFEVLADGTSNPWGVDFDRAGNAFVSACVIDHMFHMAPGGMYHRQGGTPPYPYAYELLPSIVDHKHFRAAYSGIQVYQGNQYPKEYLGTIFMGNIHDNSIHQDILTANGSTFKSSFSKDFIRANDGWFRPVSTQTGPDGALWIMDWHDKYPCYQNARADPEGVDRTYGRIWRAVYTGGDSDKKIPTRPSVDMDLKKLSTSELVALLEHPNNWHRRTAQRLLSERRDNASRALLEKLAENGKTLESRLAALWTLHSADQLQSGLLDDFTEDREPAIRAWVARLTGERRESSEEAGRRLRTLARDKDMTVRLGVAIAARQYASGNLTVNTPVPNDIPVNANGRVLADLIRSSAKDADATLAFLIWTASEPAFAVDPGQSFEWLLEDGPSTMPLSGKLTRKAMRRICDTKEVAKMDEAVRFIEEVMSRDAALTAAALDGLLEGQKGRAMLPSFPTAEFIRKLMQSGNAEIADRGKRLGTLWGDADAIQDTIRVVNNTAASNADRIKAIQAVRQIKNDSGRAALLAVASSKAPEPVLIEAVRGLGEIGGDNIGDDLLKNWRTYNQTVKRAVAEVLASRPRWTLSLLSAIDAKKIAASELHATVVRSLAQNKDKTIRERAAKAIGRIRDANADKLKVIAAKRKVVLNGKVDLEVGREIARKTCFTCHKLHGEGTEVGPDLTGVGRHNLDALLANIIDPNQIIGHGYENVEIETKDGRIVQGRLMENTDTRVKLLAAGAKEETVSRSEIENLRVSSISVMPEGLEQMPDEDFRNMIWYILNPPQDKRPLTPELRKELLGEEHSSLPRDGESVALWNPRWHVEAPDFEGSPRKLEFSGRKNVLETHPFDRSKPARLEAKVKIPYGTPKLKVQLAAHKKGDWEFRATADGELLKKQVITSGGWKELTIDLTPFAGKEVEIRLENGANGWSYEFGYWGKVEIVTDAS